MAVQKEEGEQYKSAYVTGTVLSGLLFYAKTKLGKEAKDEILASLDEKVKSILFEKDGRPVNIWPVSPYPYHTFAGILDGIVERKGIDACKDLGYLSADMDMTGRYRLYTEESFARERVNIIIKKTPDIWKEMYKKGTIAFEETIDDNNAVAYLRGFPEITENTCQLVGYWIARVAQIITGNEAAVQVSYKPRGKTGVDCEFKLVVNPAKKADLSSYLFFKAEREKKKKQDIPQKL